MVEVVAGLLALALVGVVVVALGWRKRLNEVTERYAPVIDAEAERQAILEQAAAAKREIELEGVRLRGEAEKERQASKHQTEAEKREADAEIARRLGQVEATKQSLLLAIERLHAEKATFEQEYAANKKTLKSKYDEAAAKYEKLQREINTLEESLEMIEFGVYKPHFDYTSPDRYRSALEALRDKEKGLIKDERAVVCRTEWTVGGSKVEGRKMTKQTHKLMLRAFNGECDAALAKVRWDNILKMEERVRKAAEAINKAAEVNQSYVTTEYINLKIQELRLTYELQEKLKEEKDEQKRIQEEMREEERARREIEKAREAAEKEESRYQKALEKAQEELKKAQGDKHDKLMAQIAQLQAELASAQTMKERAISQAQLTKAGHVYVISNIGSFGEDMFKIGMTRRLDPMDRVKELGDASVPFEFDVHAMVYSENAPELERKLHLEFAGRRVNLVNHRKEFFHVSLEELEDWAGNQGMELELTKIAEARDYRQSLELRKQGVAATAGVALSQQEFEVEKLFDDE